MKILSKINDFIKKDYKSANLNAGFVINPYRFAVDGWTFEDNLDSSTSWTQTGSSCTVTGGEINCNSADTDLSYITKSLGFTLGSTALFYFEFTRPTGDAGDSTGINLTSADTHSASNTGSKIIFNMNNGWAYMIMRDGAGQTGANDPSMTFTLNTKYYGVITRTASNAANLKFYTDSARTIQYGSTLSVTRTLSAEPTMVNAGKIYTFGLGKAKFDTLKVNNNSTTPP